MRNFIMRSLMLVFVALAPCPSADDGGDAYYDVLGVPFDARKREIKKAYHELSKTAHPDKKGATQKFLRLRKAYDVLKDPKTRGKYDAALEVDRDANAPRSLIGRRLEHDARLDLSNALASDDGSHELRFEVDGELRVREAGSRAVVWETGSGPTGAARGEGYAVLQRDGNLKVCAGTTLCQQVLWSSNSAVSGADAARVTAWHVSSAGVERQRPLDERRETHNSRYLALDDVGSLRVHTRTADNAYAPCAWGSNGCSAVGLGATRNSFRVLLRNLFFPSALRTSSSKARPGVIHSIFGFLRKVVGL